MQYPMKLLLHAAGSPTGAVRELWALNVAIDELADRSAPPPSAPPPSARSSWGQEDVGGAEVGPDSTSVEHLLWQGRLWRSKPSTTPLPSEAIKPGKGSGN